MDKGKVVDHKKKVFMTDCEFVVRPAGRKRALKEKRKNVHAFLKGKLSKPFKINNQQRFSYNPYKYEYFYNRQNKKKINRADCVILDFDNKLEVCCDNSKEFRKIN